MTLFKPAIFLLPETAGFPSSIIDQASSSSHLIHTHSSFDSFVKLWPHPATTHVLLLLLLLLLRAALLRCPALLPVLQQRRLYGASPPSSAPPYGTLPHSSAP